MNYPLYHLPSHQLTPDLSPLHLLRAQGVLNHHQQNGQEEQQQRRGEVRVRGGKIQMGLRERTGEEQSLLGQ